MSIEEKRSWLSEEALANLSPSQVKDLDWMIHVATWPYTISKLLGQSDQNGSSMKMSLDYCRVMKEGILQPSSQKWKTSGMGSHTEFLTLNSLESPNDAEDCLLSDVLMGIGEVPQRFYLSPTASAGLLKEQQKREKNLPPLLKKALEEQAKLAMMEEE